MKAKIIYILVFIFSVNYCSAQLTNWVWANKASGGANGKSVATDASGNVYVGGYFIGSSLQVGTSSYPHFGSTDIFVLKYDASGNVLWVKIAGGTGNDFLTDIAVDGSGNVYATGYFVSDTMHAGNFILTGANAFNPDLFLIKYDSSGNVQWAKKAGGGFYDQSWSVTTDETGDVYMAGSFASGAITFDTITLTNPGNGSYNDVFVAKFNGAGNAIWAKSFGGTDQDVAYSIAADNTGKISIAGYFGSPTISFGSTQLTNAGATGTKDIFTAKLDASTGNVAWAKAMGGSSDDWATATALDNNGDIYLSGYYKSSSLTFGTTGLTNNATIDTSDIFVFKYDAAGNPLWAKSLGAKWDDGGADICVDNVGNLFVAGYYRGFTVLFDTIPLTNAGSKDGFLLRYDTAGNLKWAIGVGGYSPDECYGIAFHSGDEVYVTGYFMSNSISFGSLTLNATSSNDMFTAKLSDITGIEEKNNQYSLVTVFPNPASTQLTLNSLTAAEIRHVEIFDMSGRKILDRNLSMKTQQQFILDVSGFDKGMYFISVCDEMHNVATKKFVKM